MGVKTGRGTDGKMGGIREALYAGGCRRGVERKLRGENKLNR